MKSALDSNRIFEKKKFDRNADSGRATKLFIQRVWMVVPLEWMGSSAGDRFGGLHISTDLSPFREHVLGLDQSGWNLCARTPDFAWDYVPRLETTGRIPNAGFESCFLQGLGVYGSGGRGRDPRSRRGGRR